VADAAARDPPWLHVLHRTRRRGSAPRTSPASPGLASTATTSSSRWTPTARTPPRSCPACSRAASTPTSCSAAAGSRAAASSTGRAAVSC
jgi:hypothetical protein